jgi:DNA-directed RNA polymerase sigma subunit (sigma70/sigma32)
LSNRTRGGGRRIDGGRAVCYADHMDSTQMKGTKRMSISTIRQELLSESAAGAFATLTALDREILVRRFGLGEGQPQSLAQIATELSPLTANRVRVLEERALRSFYELRDSGN